MHDCLIANDKWEFSVEKRSVNDYCDEAVENGN